MGNVDHMTNTQLCQRWRNGAHSWRHTHDGGFNAARYDVAPIDDDDTARRFVQAHHYSRSYPAARLRYGLYDGAALVGVMVLGIPMQAKVVTGAFPTLTPYAESLELSRLVLLDEVPANGESWFVSRGYADAAEQGVRGVVSFSDPQPRHVDGRLVMPGHVGTVYQALGATYTGRGTARTLTMLPDGSVLSDRSAQKVRAGEKGARAVVAQLVAMGAPELCAGQDPAGWLADALNAVGARKVRHGGNHRYVFRIGRTRGERSRVTVAMPSLAYPKRADELALAA